MRRLARILLLVGTCWTSTIFAAQETTPATPSTTSSQIGWLEGWRQATLSFGIVDKDPQGREFYKVIGSGVVFTISPTTAYIVTAKHVFFDPAKNWHPSELRVRFGWQDQESVYDGHGISISLRDNAGNDLWKSLSDETDIAAVKAPPPTMKNQPAVPTVLIAKEDEIFEGANIIVLGYPGIVGNEYLVRAINRGGIIAWLNPKAAYTSAFLIDANIYPGNSGGPVIKVPGGFNKQGSLVLGGRAAFLGIVSQAPGQVQEIELRVPGSILPLKIHQEIPLGGNGIVVPAAEVAELLDSLRVPLPSPSNP